MGNTRSRQRALIGNEEPQTPYNYWTIEEKETASKLSEGARRSLEKLPHAAMKELLAAARNEYAPPLPPPTVVPPSLAQTPPAPSVVVMAKSALAVPKAVLEIHAVIQNYIDGMMESSTELIEKAFHPSAMITGYLGPDFLQLSRNDFAEYCKAQQPSPRSKGDKEFYEVVSLEINDTTAVAKVRDTYLGHDFCDMLSFMCVDGKWSIYNKVGVPKENLLRTLGHPCVLTLPIVRRCGTSRVHPRWRRRFTP